MGQSIMLRPTLFKQPLQTEPKSSPKAITVQLSTITTHFHWKKKQNFHTKPTSLDRNYDGILKCVSVLFMSANVTDPTDVHIYGVKSSTQRKQEDR